MSPQKDNGPAAKKRVYKRAATTETKLNECEAITHPPEGSPGMRSGRLSHGASDLQTELRDMHSAGASHAADRVVPVHVWERWGQSPEHTL